ncbi:unnamed protein product [Toxocara canis]|uniref:Transmembrane protein n=1 Tax=Toxocara canis TaxID=6265 RepID=A0A183UVR5_TOXCA|nr:unnamed protein product [Toxocara canis]
MQVGSRVIKAQAVGVYERACRSAGRLGIVDVLIGSKIMKCRLTVVYKGVDLSRVMKVWVGLGTTGVRIDARVMNVPFGAECERAGQFGDYERVSRFGVLKARLSPGIMTVTVGFGITAYATVGADKRTVKILLQPYRFGAVTWMSIQH